MKKAKTFLAHPTTRTLGNMLMTGGGVLFGFAFILKILSVLLR
jgi:hypothetical protein